MWNPCFLILATVAAPDPADEAPSVRKPSPAKAAVDRLYGYTPTRWRRWPQRPEAAKNRPSLAPQLGPRMAPAPPKPTVPATAEESAAESPSPPADEAADTLAVPTLIAPAVAETDNDAQPAVQLLEPLPLGTGAPKKRTWFAEWLRSIPTKNSASTSDAPQPDSAPETASP